MDYEDFIRQVEQLLKEQQSYEFTDDNFLQRAFEVFRQIEAVMSAENDNGSVSEFESDALIDAQFDLIQATRLVKAKSINDILYKLALWRWSIGDLSTELQPCDAVAYSAFLDLTEILGETSVLKQNEKH